MDEKTKFQEIVEAICEKHKKCCDSIKRIVYLEDKMNKEILKILNKKC